MKKRYEMWRKRRRINTAVTVLKEIDETMAGMGMSRQKRAQVWRGFIKSPAQRLSIFDTLERKP